MPIISTNNCNYTNNQRNSIYKSHLVNTVKYYFLKILIPLFKLNINIVLSDYFLSSFVAISLLSNKSWLMGL